jgi:hypothetical protein
LVLAEFRSKCPGVKVGAVEPKPVDTFVIHVPTEPMKVMTPASGLLSPPLPSATVTVVVPSVSLRSKSARAGEADSNAIVARVAVRANFRIVILRGRRWR